MVEWTFYPAFFGTLISIVSLTQIKIRHHDKRQPRTLSALAASRHDTFIEFRNILWLCNTLFAITAFGYLVPKFPHPILISFTWGLVTIGIYILALIPARGKTLRTHEFFSETMSVGMLLSVILFWLNTQGVYQFLEGLLALTMTSLAAMIFIDKKRFIYYELYFIFLSHFSILIAVISLNPS